ncbi:MAG: hypothetical protein SO155_01980 [Candidatus Ventricola sp.]|nr:hypothetical protein [Candidatus Ventricola sp.]
MQDIILQQRNAAKPLTGKSFLLSIAGILLRLAIAQIAVNLLIAATGAGLLNIAFYVYAILLLVGFMRATVAGYVYTLKEDELVLERRLGDSTITLVQIPLDHVVSLREVRVAENLKTTYRQVTHIDPDTKPPLRVRAAFGVSLFSSRLARLLAGKGAQDVIGHVLVYDEGNLRCACTFRSNQEMLGALAQRLGERYGFDERMTRSRVHTLYARALERAFPALYPYVDPLVKPEDVAWAREEIARQKAENREKKNPAGKKTDKAAAESAQDAPRRRRKQG